MPKQGAYVGRLAFDPDTELHIDPDGKPIVTDDGGKTWRYATDDDASHNDRYGETVITVDSTANQLAALSYEHGAERAAGLVEAHHFEVQPEDPHFDRVRFDPDAKAAKITGHTEAYS